MAGPDSHPAPALVILEDANHLGRSSLKMPEPYTPIDYAAAALALVDNLMIRLRDKGVLTEPDTRQIVADAIHGAATSPDREVQNAADLLRLIYNKP